ncbi:MAG: extracellular solute-binding protein [Phycisphaerales bacterium]
MNWQKIGVLVAFLLVLGVPLTFKPRAERVPADVPRVVIITPHNEQIRHEFSVAFREWHEAQYGSPAAIEWISIGGTSEIRKMLESMFVKALASGQLRPDANAPGVREDGLDTSVGSMAYDLMFGGGSYDHSVLSRPIEATGPGGETVAITISRPMDFEQSQLDAWFGDNVIGSGVLYDPDQYWIGTALSSFGIVYNRDVLAKLEVPAPNSWSGMLDPRLAGWVALADPRQSGSVTTTYDSILSNYGWERGWRMLREMSANTRYFSNSSSKVPLDVSRGEAAMGVAIDFYGRYQSQAVRRPGEAPDESRVGYIDPAGAVYIDADPVSMLRGGPSPDLARRFVEFTLTEKAQSLWQFPVAAGVADLGPERFELRRMPSRRVMYEKYGDRFVDDLDPFNKAMTASTGRWRSAISPMMSAFSIDIHHDQAAAWRALNDARGRVSDETMAEMERLFYAMPTHVTPDGERLLFDEANYDAIRADWKRAQREGAWDEIRIAYTKFFRDNYRKIVRLSEQAS